MANIRLGPLRFAFAKSTRFRVGPRKGKDSTMRESRVSHLARTLTDERKDVTIRPLMLGLPTPRSPQPLFLAEGSPR